MSASAPDSIALETRLHEARLPWQLSYRPTVQSTQQVARQLVTSHGRHHWLILAGEQVAGRGRQDRIWSSQLGDFTATFVWPLDLPADRWGKLGLLGGLVMATAIREVTGLEAEVKWPNDVFIAGAKVGGCLGEVINTPDGPVALLGMGLNLITTALPAGQPAPRYPIASLQRDDTTWTIIDLASAIAAGLHRRHDWCRAAHDANFAAWWIELSMLNHRAIRFSDDGEARQAGTVIGITPVGRLRVELENGTISEVLAGDIEF